MNGAILLINSVATVMMMGCLWLFPKSTKLVLVFFVLVDVGLVLLVILSTWIWAKLFSH